MSSFKKLFKSFKNEHLLGIVGLVFLVIALCQYSKNKNIFQLGMTTMSSPPSENPIVTKSTTSSLPSKVVGASANSAYAPYNGAPQHASNSRTSPSVINKPQPPANPSDLLPSVLPSDANSSWAAMNPVGNMKSVNLLNPQQVVGINTQGSSLRNANLQLRSEPPNPRTNTNCPWNISTIEDDKFRKPLEIGSAQIS